MSYTYGQFWNEVFDSLERDQRFESLVDVACNRGIDEVFAESNFGNNRYETDSENGREEYDLPDGTMYVNFVTFDNIPMDRITFLDYLQRKSFAMGGAISSTRPDGFVVKDNRALLLSPMPRLAKKIVIYSTVKTDDLTYADNADDNFPVSRVYTKSAFHFARHFLYLQDNRDEDAKKEYTYFEHEQGKINRRLNGSKKTKVTRLV